VVFKNGREKQRGQNDRSQEAFFAIMKIIRRKLLEN
jgi:hypothetical protein